MRDQVNILKLFLVGIEPSSISAELRSHKDLLESRYDALFSVVLEEAINEWNVSALAEIGVASKALFSLIYILKTTLILISTVWRNV